MKYLVCRACNILPGQIWTLVLKSRGSRFKMVSPRVSKTGLSNGMFVLVNPF